MQGWFGFYSVIGGLAATLLGLLFVAISVNAKAILGEGHENSRRLAEQAFQNYIAVILVALLAIIPTIEIATFASVILAFTALWAVLVIVRLYLALTRPHDPGLRWQAIRRHVLSVVGFAILILAVLKMAFGAGDGRGLCAIAVIVLLFSATAVSWELLLKLGNAAKSN